MKLQQLFFLQRMLPDRLSGSTRATPSPCRPRGMNEVFTHRITASFSGPTN